MDIAAELKKYQDALRQHGTDPMPLSAQAQTLVLLSDADFETLLEAFDMAANDASYYVTAYDCDFGALLLEALADSCGDGKRKRGLYIGAKRRAEIFASYASSGGEGLARSQGMERIVRKITNVSDHVGNLKDSNHFGLR